MIIEEKNHLFSFTFGLDLNQFIINYKVFTPAQAE